MSVSSSPKRLIISILLFVLAAYLGWALYASITDILSFDDFEVYHFIGGVASARNANIYELTTPHQQRGPFLYPISASVLLIPLSWLPHDLAGVVFSIVKVACLALLWFGGVWFSGRRPIDAAAALVCTIGPLIMLHRVVTSDVGNGQINLLLAAAAVGGIWMIMRPMRLWWIGSLLLAYAIAMKLTPALLLAVPLLNRQWKGLCVTIVLALLLLFALPIFWFGGNGFARMSTQYRDVAARFTFDWAAPHEQTTPTELFQFVRLQNGDAMTTPADAPDILPVPISGYAGERLFEPKYRAPATRFWLGFGLAAGATFLLGRRWILRSRDGSFAPDWTWDLAMLCGFIILLSPRSQKAHLVILIIPAAWLAARICRWSAPGAVPAGSRQPIWGIIAYVALCAVFLIAESLKIRVNGWEDPLRCLPMVGVLMLVLMVAVVGWLDARSGALDLQDHRATGNHPGRAGG